MKPDPAEVLGTIAGVLSGSEWNADTLDVIAELVRSAGFEVADARGPEL